MTLTEFSQHSDAFKDAKGDIDWSRLMTLLDQGDQLGAGQYLDKHFSGLKECLEEEIGTGESGIYDEEERLDRRDRARECQRGFGN